MSYKNVVAEKTTITRNVSDIGDRLGNLYEGLVTISKRSRQINDGMKEELTAKLAEFASSTDNLEEMAYMPETCAYKRLNEGKKLFKWHPLITGNPNSVKEAGISVAGRVISEEGMSDEDMEDRVVNWPMTTITRKPK